MVRVAFKPTATIARNQRTVSRDGRDIELRARGRHDPCVVGYAVPLLPAPALDGVPELWFSSFGFEFGVGMQSLISYEVLHTHCHMLPGRSRAHSSPASLDTVLCAIEALVLVCLAQMSVAGCICVQGSETILPHLVVSR